MSIGGFLRANWRQLLLIPTLCLWVVVIFYPVFLAYAVGERLSEAQMGHWMLDAAAVVAMLAICTALHPFAGYPKKVAASRDTRAQVLVLWAVSLVLPFALVPRTFSRLATVWTDEFFLPGFFVVGCFVAAAAAYCERTGWFGWLVERWTALYRPTEQQAGIGETELVFPLALWRRYCIWLGRWLLYLALLSSVSSVFLFSHNLEVLVSYFWLFPLALVLALELELVAVGPMGGYPKEASRFSTTRARVWFWWVVMLLGPPLAALAFVDYGLLDGWFFWLAILVLGVSGSAFEAASGWKLDRLAWPLTFPPPYMRFKTGLKNGAANAS